MSDPNAGLSSSSLYRDLMAEAHDSMYRAMTYLAQRGGPSIVGSAEDPACLRTNQPAMVGWLSDHPDKQTLIDGYALYRKQWSPIFRD
ncbi:MAG: hypothetical protein ACREJU_02630 [Nitrospiraceae bacterium]